MASHSGPGRVEYNEQDDLLDAEEAAEEISEDGDVPMKSDEEDQDEEDEEEVELQNDSAAYFDAHRDSIYCIAQHPIHSHIVATGSGDDIAYIYDSTPPSKPVLPTSYETSPSLIRESISPLSKLEGHTDSVNTIAFTLPSGELLATGGLDGSLKVWRGNTKLSKWSLVAEVQEVEEINWLAQCPNPKYPNVIALGANDGSVWVYKVDLSDSETSLHTISVFYQHTQSCTAGSWTPSGEILVTVSEDSSLFAWDVFGDASAAGVKLTPGSQSIFGITADDERFKVEGGLYCVAVSPDGTLAAAGGSSGNIRVVGLPRITKGTSEGSKSSKQPTKKAQESQAARGQTGQLISSLRAQTDSVESISFSQPPVTLMAAASVDGSIVVFDVAHKFGVRRQIQNAHGTEAVIKVEFVRNTGPEAWLLTSCGNDGAVRRWDTRGNTATTAQGLQQEWKGHRGGGDGGGILDFVQGDGSQIVTAGDE